MTTRLIRSLCWAFALLALLGVIRPAPAQVQLAASTGDVTWAGRTRAASGNLVSMLMRVYVPPSATSGTLTIGVGATGGARHKFTVGADLALGVASGNTVGGTRTATYSTTNTEGRWIWYAVLIPANYIGGGAVKPSLWYDANGTWSTAAGASSGSDPTGTIGDTAGTVQITNGTNAAVVVGPVYLWAGADSPDTLAEMRSVALGSTAPETFTGLIFAGNLRDNYTDTYGVDVDGTATGGALVDHSGLPTWFGVRHHALIDIDPAAETSTGIKTTIANRALTGGAWTVPATCQGGEIVDNVYGTRCAYLGEDTTGVTPYSWEAPANGPIVHNRYCTVIVVGGAVSSPGSTAWNILATGATDLQLQLLGQARWGFNSSITDASDREASTPMVHVFTLSAAPVEHTIGTFAKVTHASFVCGAGTPTSGTIRLGAPTGSTSTLTRYWLSRLIVVEGNLVDADVQEIIASLTARHRCRNYYAGLSRLIVGEGQSSLAGSWDYRRSMGFLHRTAAMAPRTTLVYNCATGGQTFTNHDADRVNTVQYIAETLCAGAVRKDFVGQMGSNDLDIASPDAAAVTTSMQTYITAIDPYYDRISILQIAPRAALTATQAAYAAAVTTYNANLLAITGNNRTYLTYFTNYGAGGDWSANPTYYNENPNGIHLNGAGTDLYWLSVWRNGVKAMYPNASGRSSRVNRGSR